MGGVRVDCGQAWGIAPLCFSAIGQNYVIAVLSYNTRSRNSAWYICNLIRFACLGEDIVVISS